MSYLALVVATIVVASLIPRALLNLLLGARDE